MTGAVFTLQRHRTSATAMGVRSCPVSHSHTQIAAGLEQLVILTRVTFSCRDGGKRQEPTGFAAIRAGGRHASFRREPTIRVPAIEESLLGARSRVSTANGENKEQHADDDLQGRRGPPL
jgi:hypothetical protein